MKNNVNVIICTSYVLIYTNVDIFLFCFYNDLIGGKYMKLVRHSHMPYVDLSQKEDDFSVLHIGFDDFEKTPAFKHSRIHEFYSIHFILEGSGIFNIRNKRYVLKQYDIFLVPPGEVISYYPDKKDPWKYVWFDLIGKKAKFYCQKIGFIEDIFVLKTEKNIDIFKLVSDYVTKTENQIEIGYYHALAVFYNFLNIIISPNKSQKVLTKELILSYIETNFYNPNLTIEKICTNFNISHSYLCKMFKSTSGLKKTLVDIRINKAKMQLLSTELSISEVCYSVGFKDFTHFMKTFKKYTSMTASEYRKLHATSNNNTK